MSEKPIYWFCHLRHWFGFEEPAHVVQDEGGCYFANAAGKQIYSIAQNGMKVPHDVQAIRTPREVSQVP